MQVRRGRGGTKINAITCVGQMIAHVTLSHMARTMTSVIIIIIVNLVYFICYYCYLICTHYMYIVCICTLYLESQIFLRQLLQELTS